MNLRKYVPLAVRTEKPLPLLGRMQHSCMGLITEVGEVTTELKRMAIYGKPLDAERKAHILEEIGDVMWYVAIMMDVLQADFDEFEAAPKFVPPDHTEGMYEAMAMVLGDNVGKLCKHTQLTIVNEGMTTDSLADMFTSLTMIMSAVGLLAKACDSSLELAMVDNITKLRVRFPDAYSNEAAEGRADKNGLDARNS